MQALIRELPILLDKQQSSRRGSNRSPREESEPVHRQWRYGLVHLQASCFVTNHSTIRGEMFGYDLHFPSVSGYCLLTAHQALRARLARRILRVKTYCSGNRSNLTSDFTFSVLMIRHNRQSARKRDICNLISIHDIPAAKITPSPSASASFSS